VINGGQQIQPLEKEIIKEEPLVEQRELPVVQEVVQEGSSYRIIKNPSADLVGSAGTVEDFLSLFNDRFRRIKRIYMGRIDTQGAVSPATAKLRKDDARRRKALKREGMRSQRQSIQKVIGIVKNKSISRSRNIIIELEDEEESIICVIPAGRESVKGKELSAKGNALVLDEIICISGFVDQDARMIADDVIYPDIPTVREIGRARRDVYATFISDLHCGSQEFLEDDLDRFIAWLDGRDVDSEDREMVDQIRYLFIAGDMVDGIGVYPSQKDDLALPSIYDQYGLVAEKLRKIPDRIQTFCIPGNHDACRQALPRPPVPPDFAEALYSLGENVILLGDPSQVIVEGVNVLLTHGDSLDDMVTTLPGASYVQPETSMIELLKKRHLVPIYGGKTELAPLARDWMVIDTPPDVVHFGHAHHNAVNNYRGVQVINSGTFQDQTDFMRKQGIQPTPGIVTLLNLHSGVPLVKVFHDYSQNDML
jgi:DNA polymerase II small subunit